MATSHKQAVSRAAARSSKGAVKAGDNGAARASKKRQAAGAAEPPVAVRSPARPARPAVATPRVRGGARSAAAKVVDAENWDQRLGFLMHDVSRLRRTVFDDFVRPLGVTRSQWWVLAHLARHDGMIQSDLAKVLELGKAALGGLIDRLEASELILRRPDEIDGRAKRVFVSAKGYALISQMRGPSHEMSERILQGMSQARRHALVDLLTQVRHNLLAIKTETGGEGDDEAP